LVRAAAALPAGTPLEPLELGRIQPLHEGRDVLLLAAGLAVAQARGARDRLARQGIDAGLANVHTLKPLDEDFVRAAGGRHRLLVTVENHSIVGGLGSAVAEVLAESGSAARLLRLGVRDRFAEGASLAYLFARHGLDGAGIASRVQAAWRAL
jgi:transketolase